LSYGIPRFAFHKGYERRDHFHVSIRRWLVDAWDRYDWSAPDVDWEENLGSRLMRTREKTFKETVGSSLDSRASSEMGLLFVSVSLFQHFLALPLLLSNLQANHDISSASTEMQSLQLAGRF
jgi:hypothetical protein